MDNITNNILRRLIDVDQQICISIYLPTFKKGSETEQNSIKFKNLISEAEEKIQKLNKEHSEELTKNLKDASNLIDDHEFWQHQSDGLALFISKVNFDYFRVAINFEELVVVTKSFHLKPLFSVLNSDRFYVLFLSQKSAQLFNCTDKNISKVEVEGMPEKVEEVLDENELEKQLQFHTETPQVDSGAGRPAIFHGTGAADIDKDVYTLKYFREIDKTLSGYLANEDAPLVLCCVDFLLPIYNKANNYNHLYQENVSGNPESFTDTEIHEKSFDLLKSYFKEGRDNSIERYKKLLGQKSDIHSDILSDIVVESFSGKVDTLFVTKNLQKWGNFDKEKLKISFSDENTAGSEDLFNLASIYTFMNSGKVFVLDQDLMPENSEIAAIFRY